MRGASITLIILVVALIIVVGLIVFIPGGDNVFLQPTDSESAVSQVTIDTVVAINRTAALSLIDFGNVDPPIDNRNATQNYPGGLGSSPTSYAVQRQVDSTVDVQICISASGPLTETQVGTATIPLASETYDFDSTATAPILTQEASFTTSPVLGSGSLSGTDLVYYRFWLDVTNPAQASGVYNNSITFTGIAAGTPC